MESKRRVGVDSNILVAGILSEWGAAKGILILAATQVFTLVLLSPVEKEVERAIASTARGQVTLKRLLELCRPERHPVPLAAEIHSARRFLPVLRHSNDLPVLASALVARPDWFVSDNTAHFGPDLAAATGLHILTSSDFLRRLIVPVP